MPTEDLADLELMLNRFHRLIAELLGGKTGRNSFLPWELDILLDMETCQFERRRRKEILRQYQRAVTKQMQRGPGPPMKLSGFLRIRAERAATRPPRRQSRAAPLCDTLRSVPAEGLRYRDDAPVSEFGPKATPPCPHPSPEPPFA